MVFTQTALRNLELRLAMAWTGVAQAELDLARARAKVGARASKIAAQILDADAKRGGMPSLSRGTVAHREAPK